MLDNFFSQPLPHPAEIERKSMQIIENEVPEPRPFQGQQWLVVRRMIHTSADFSLLQSVKFHKKAIIEGKKALHAGCRIFTDTEMARSAIPMRRMTPLGCSVNCFMNDPAVLKEAKALGTTRAFAAINHIAANLAGSIVVIGNAPTALLRLLDIMEEGGPLPALVVGMPVGFVNAKESKDLLMALDIVPYITVSGRKGGSALAGACVNALADIAGDELANVEKAPFLG